MRLRVMILLKALLSLTILVGSMAGMFGLKYKHWYRWWWGEPLGVVICGVVGFWFGREHREFEERLLEEHLSRHNGW